MTEFTAYTDIWRKSINREMLLQAFESYDIVMTILTGSRHLIQAPAGALIMHGSFVNGRCENPKSPYFLQAPDSGRCSDLDLILIDGLLFRDLPYRERCFYESLPIGVMGHITHSLVYPNGGVKDYLKKPGTTWFSLYTWLKMLCELTNRKIDFRVYDNWNAWNTQQRSYWLLADQKRSYVDNI